ncbi:MAG: hypothetical protein LLG06_10040 [Desulfobacteraceae bacterium]|nr:hypothetical protein [Desulfobacteraceae bacterium]
MLGSITTTEKCPLCKGRMEDNGFTAVACPNHPKEIAKKLRVRLERKKGEATQKQFTCESGFESYKLARRFLDGLRFKIEEGTFDHRDYKASNPLGFENLINEWLTIKEGDLKKNSFTPVYRYARYAIDVWHQKNVKTFDHGDIEKFLKIDLKHLSSKSKENAKSVLHDFFEWCRKGRKITHEQMPEFPELKVVMGMRNLVDKETQGCILDRVKEMYWDVNPRIWICMKWLATYFIRPGEALGIRERDINLNMGLIQIQPETDKVGKGKFIPMRDEDIELVRSLPRSFDPNAYFFRHLRGYGGPGGTHAGAPFHYNYIARRWNAAASSLGISGVSLYPGTKHSSVTALGELFTPEQIKGASQIATNKAFERYFQQIPPSLVRSIFDVSGGTSSRPNKAAKQGGGDGKVTEISSSRKAVKPLPVRD